MTVMALQVVSLRRYPVKSMGGEALTTADLDRRGLVGDRWAAVTDEQGYLASGKSTRRFRLREEVFRYRAATNSDGAVEVSGNGGAWRVGEAGLDGELSRAMGVAVNVRAEDEVAHQDAGSVSLVGTASLRWCREHLGIDADSRRLRVNIVFESHEPFIEETWVGRTIQVGGCTLAVAARIDRCRMVDIAQDGITPEHRLLKPLTEHRDMCLAVYADVCRPGTVAVGDPVSPPVPKKP